MPLTNSDIAAKARRLELRGGTAEGEFDWRHKVVRAGWYVVQATLFRLPMRRGDLWRCLLLRAFGAKVGRRCLVRRTAQVEIPWHLAMGDDVTIGDRVIVYSLAGIVIGDRTMVSQGAHLCAGDHDFSRTGMPLRRIPISIGSDAWIAAEAFVGPGVDVGDGVVLGARAAAFSDLPDWTVCVGSPARARRRRDRPTSRP